MIVTGTGSALPEKIVTNFDLVGFLDTSDEWISKRTGISERRLLSSEKLQDIAAESARKALKMAGLSADDIDYIILSNVVNQYQTPSLSCLVQQIIGSSCPCVDINGACCGFVYALELANGLLKSGRYKNILVICAEANSLLVDWADRSTCVLFGDAASTAVVTGGGHEPVFKMGAKPCSDVLYAKNPSGTSPYSPCEEREYLKMNGQEVYKFAVNTAVADIEWLLGSNGLAPSDISYYLIHQANMRITESARARLNLPQERFPANIGRFGNTSSASVALLLDELNRGGKFSSGDYIALSAFGAGLTSAAALLKWSAIT